jgi:alpha-L-rhamnosidase
LIQALTIFRLTGDVRLWKRAVLDFNASRLPMGLTQSRYPSCQVQVIPTFSLVYINMIEEYLLHTGDSQTVRRCLRGLEQIVDWFTDHLTADEALGILPWWNFVDWTREWPGGDPSGMTSAEPHNKKPSSTHNFLFASAMQSLSRIYQWLGEREKSAQMNKRAEGLLGVIGKIFRDPQTGLFIENPDSDVCSEHANVLAILTDAVPPDEQCEIAKSLDGQAPLIRCGYQFEFYLARALSKTGRNDLMVNRLNHWQKVFDLHLVTTPERRLEEGAVSRSDNHAWSAWTPHWMLSEVLGVQPVTPGFKEIRICPDLGGLAFAEGDMPLPTGVLRLRVEENETGWSISGELPPAVYQLKDLSGKVHELSGGAVDLTGRKGS